jgi:N6-L-threonylcarbamoyladenine synthase
MSRTAILGIDTSNYCTSLCLIDTEGNRLADRRQWLSVAEGEKGLQQSAAVFQHVRNLPLLFESVDLNGIHIGGVCVSRTPRPVEGSYMPVFQVGTGWGTSLAHAWGAPCFFTTHQEGHIEAGVKTADRPMTDGSFLAVHLSGGTTEVLQVDPLPDGYRVELLGGTRDLNAGQLVDRLGVSMGLSFPAGRELENIALQADSSEKVTVPSSVQGLQCSFSGPATHLLRMWERREASKEAIAYAAFRCIANTLEKLLLHAWENRLPQQVLIVGGVAANRLIRERLRSRLEHPAVGASLHFADPRFSGDNAYGVASLGLKKSNVL